MTEIRKTAAEDIPHVLEIYDIARAYMRKTGNMNQWINGYPQQQDLEQDIKKGNSYVYCIDTHIAATFYFGIEEEPSYKNIYGGTWLNGNPYGVIHRIAVKEGKKGIATACLNACFEKIHNIRIDTHRDNTPMRAALEKNGFRYCGIIYLLNGDERLAFQKTQNPPLS